MLHRVAETRVSRILQIPGCDPVPIPDNIMIELRQSLGETGKIYAHFDKRGPKITVGQKFRFGEGSPFFGFLAEILRVTASDRIVARLSSELFGSKGRELDANISEIGELLEAS